MMVRMTNYRIDRIETQYTKLDHIDKAKQGQVYESTVSRYEYWENGHWYEQ